MLYIYIEDLCDNNVALLTHNQKYISVNDQGFLIENSSGFDADNSIFSIV